MKTITLTFPTAVILLREVSNHFGLKNYTGLADQIDEYALNIHYPHYFEEHYLNALFDTQYFSAQIKQFLVHDFKNFIREYYQFSQMFSLCSQPHDKLQQQFINTMLAVKVIPIIKQRLITSELVSKNHKSHFLKEVFSRCKTVTKLDKELQDRIRVWSNLEELPEPSKLKEFSKKCDFKQQDKILSNLLLARALDSLFKHEIYEEKLTNNLFDGFIRQNLSDENQNAYNLIALHDFTYTSLLQTPKQDLFLEAYKTSRKHILELLYKRVPTYPEQLEYCLTNIKWFFEIIDSYPEFENLRYFGLWAQARYELFNGSLDQAIYTYANCVETSILYDARYLEQIISEALVTCSLKDKPSSDLLRKLVNIAIRYNLRLSKIDANFDDYPNRFKLENVFETWELDAIKAKTFDIFNKDAFLESNYTFLTSVPKSQFLTLADNILIDLKNPNKIINGATERKVKMPQLLYAVLKRDVNAVQELLERGASVNLLSGSGDSVLTTCLNDNILELDEKQDQILELLLQKEYSPATLNTIAIKKRLSVLHLAVQIGAPSLVSKLLQLGCNANLLADIDHHSPLHLALKLLGYQKKNPSFDDFIKAIKSHPEQSQLSLYRHSAGHLDLKSVLNNLHTLRGYQIGKEAFEAMKPNVDPTNIREIIHILLNAGADVNQAAKLPISGYTPLMLALEDDEYEIARYMVDHCKGDLNKTYIDTRNGNLVSAKHIIEYFKATQCEALLN